ncbi:MAG: SixA phosphatase family protein [Actinomadura sp.]
MTTLIVLRHAKAERGFGSPDADRSLTGRGRRDATAAGEWLSTSGLAPDLVLCSPSARTRETLECLAVDAAVGYQPEIYDDDVEALFQLLRETGEQVGTLLLIGHNPTVHQLVHDLTGDGGAAFPTCALAVIEIADGWAGTWPGAGRRTAFWSPKTPH